LLGYFVELKSCIAVSQHYQFTLRLG